MSERSAEQTPVQTRPDRQDTARIPLAERLQRRITAASTERANGGQAPQSSSRVLPPMPAELRCIAIQSRQKWVEPLPFWLPTWLPALPVK